MTVETSELEALVASPQLIRALIVQEQAELLRLNRTRAQDSGHAASIEVGKKEARRRLVEYERRLMATARTSP